MMIVAPLAAMLVQMAISRTREYAADRAARKSAASRWLASALNEDRGAAHQIPNEAAERNPATAHMFIINPLSGGAHGQPVLDPSGDRKPQNASRNKLKQTRRASPPGALLRMPCSRSCTAAGRSKTFSSTAKPASSFVRSKNATARLRA
jgi:hypothetical protein